MALGAVHRAVRAGEGITRVRVIEGFFRNRRGLPVGRVVTGLAFGPEASLVLVFVARYAGRREAHPGVREILAGKARALWGCYELWQVAVATGNLRVFAIENEAGL